MNFRLFASFCGTALLAFTAPGANPEAPVSARELADSLSARQEGTTYVRLRLEIKQPDGASKGALQVQIKERRTKSSTDAVYQVLWPKERKGEAVLLHKSGGRAPSGYLLVPPEKPRALTAAQMSDPLFGSSLSYQDVIENFFAWESQAIAGNETVDRVNCVILESKPGKGDNSAYGSVRSWIDPRRLVPLRVEKYLPSGKLARRIDTTRVANDDKGHPIPANLAVRTPRDDSVSELDGSRIRHDVSYTDRDFSPEALGDLAAPHAGGD